MRRALDIVQEKSYSKDRPNFLCIVIEEGRTVTKEEEPDNYAGSGSVLAAGTGLEARAARKRGCMDMKFYKCAHCGNIICYVENKGVPVMCCGQKMDELVPGTTDGAVEKHVPVVTVEGNMVTVTVGSVAHPMMAEHYIQWICLQTKEGSQLKYLAPGAEPKAVFALSEGDEVAAVFEYCNLHGLWKA